jgi:iron complex outermembrane receptor protein
VNVGEVRAKGLELETQMRLGSDIQALASYSIQNAVDQETHLKLTNSPRHILQGRVSMRGPLAGSSVAVDGQYLSARGTLAGAAVPAAATLNLTMTQPLGPAWELFGGVRNIFDNRYSDPVSAGHLQDSIAQNGRTARVGLRWRSGTRP